MNSFSCQSFKGNDVAYHDDHQKTLATEERDRFQFILGIVFCCLGLAIFFAPERPQQFASICEKYNTTNACQVW